MAPSEIIAATRPPRASQPRTRQQPGVAHLRALIDDVSAGVFTFDATLSLRHVNARLASLLALPADIGQRARSVIELLGSSPILEPPAAQRLHEACLAAAGGAETHGLTLTIPPRSLVLDITRIADGSCLAVLEDTTDRVAAEADAVERALHDPLTGLPTRRLFQSRLASSLASSLADPACVALLIVNLDRFKAVNDTLGHPVGDALLALAAKRLRTIVRETDLVARLGGDEFAILVAPAPGDTSSSNTNEAALKQLSARIIDLLSRPYLVQGHLVNVGASVGIAVAPGQGATPQALFSHADLALNNAKQDGRSVCRFFAPDMDERALARRQLEIDLRKALTLGEFELHYQAQVELGQEPGQNRLVGFEALLRWRHPTRGVVSPGDFIPLAEEIGLIVPIGEWVVREACAEAIRWPDTIAVAVNVSPLQFAHPVELVDTIRRALAASGLPGRRLEIEITETSLIRNEEHVLAALHGIRALGVRVAMDDFGTGYSSLSQLHSFPFDKIKIDRSFIMATAGAPPGSRNASQDAVIRAIAALGASLGMSTIAEGVETADQLSRIRAEGCTSVQGYLFSRPVPVSGLSALIASFAPTNPDPANPNFEETSP